MVKEIYLDNAATTKIDEKVLKEMLPYLKNKYGNASSIYDKGVEAMKVVDDSRKIVADSINAASEEIIFTSGGTESNNFALKGIVMANPEKKHIITTKIEHPSILNTCEFLKSMEIKIDYLTVNEEGLININELKSLINKNTLLVSIIHGNNEIGTIQDIQEIGKICRDRGVYLHVDACQSFMKIKIDVKKMNIDLMTLNAHKIHGPKGVGVLFIRKGIKIIPLFHGGGQEKNIRGGTENVAGIVGFAKAVSLYNNKDIEKMKRLRDEAIKELLNIPKTYLNGPVGDKRLSNNINIRFDGIEGESILGLLNEKGIYVSTGSACSSKNLKPSHVLLAIGLKPENAHGSIRISLSKYTTDNEIKELIKNMYLIVKKLRNMSPFWENEK
jgi:cysteine desulfurase